MRTSGKTKRRPQTHLKQETNPNWTLVQKMPITTCGLEDSSKDKHMYTQREKKMYIKVMYILFNLPDVRGQVLHDEEMVCVFVSVNCLAVSVYPFRVVPIG